MSSQDADKLIGCGDANCALIYISFLRRGSASSGELCRALGLSRQAVGAAAQKLKEVKFHVNIDDHDYQTKLKHALDFLEKGCRLKITLALRGREMAHQDLAFQLMDQVMAALAPYADADGKPKMLWRNISVNFAPK